MKVLFIVPYPTSGPSNRFRVEQYLPHLDLENIAYRVRPFCNNEFYFLLRKNGYYFKKFAYLLFFSFRRILDLLCSPAYDIVFIHREAFPTKDCVFEWLFRMAGKKLIYDFDDAIFLKKPAKVKAVVRMSDSVIAGNEFLKDYASVLNKEVAILPTCIDTDRYKPAVKKGNDRTVVIGWIGTSSTSIYLHPLRNVFKFLTEKYKNIELRIVGGNTNADEDTFTIKKDWALESEVRELQEFDIGIMPMPDNEWTKGKCAFKIIQYMAVGIPSVASPVGMNLKVIQDGLNGSFASSNEEWIDRLSRLIENAALRDSMGRNGRKTTEERYSLKVAAPKFVAILEKVSQGRRRFK